MVCTHEVFSRETCKARIDDGIRRRFVIAADYAGNSSTGIFDRSKFLVLQCGFGLRGSRLLRHSSSLLGNRAACETDNHPKCCDGCLPLHLSVVIIDSPSFRRFVPPSFHTTGGACW